MARSQYGLTPGEVVVSLTASTFDDPKAIGLASATLTIWSYDRSTQLTDLQTCNPANPTAPGSAISSVTPLTDGTGRSPFQGPDGVNTALWGLDGANWWLFNPADLANRGNSAPVTWATIKADPSFNAGAIRSDLGAGTSSLAIGTTSSTAKAGDYQPTAANISDATTVGRDVLKAVDGPAALAAIGGLASTAVPPIVLTNPQPGDVLGFDSDGVTLVNQTIGTPATNPYELYGDILNPGQAVPSDWPSKGIAFVRGSAPTLGVTILAQGGFTSSNTSLALTPANAVNVGENVFVGLVGNPPSSGVASTVTQTDSGSNTYSARGSRVQGATLQALAFSGRATTALTTSSTITSTLSVAVSNLQGVAVKLAGLASPAIDQQGANSGVSISSLTIAAGGATAQPSEIAVLVVGFNGTSNSITVPTGWTQVGITQTMSDFAPKYCAVFYQVLTTVQTVSVTVNTGVSGTIIGLLNTFKAA